ncbi:hypothetical protein Isop_3580 [Isosphaera pallida ATCC 43644]|jgi:glyoxylase-like metal-dependent hydrolase (beta-lactamase superfamily II)|uniref:Metallo-beta-lactamase domain-containing protein n=1 Tax=Isosphaera pallida (strain ATCC 43644 / DSM 9630 / IS1B) TaxID=575540 RepID=E8QYF4_ISOPI|nr:MBL fold metallo-hydrolase [Isosphaera pallida]ADV64137.1 hypothetical protein Isop_3580 [Isosphaera pallida ATCC 43644]
MNEPRIVSVISRAFQENAYLLWRSRVPSSDGDARGRPPQPAVLFDPGEEVDRILAAIAAENLTIEAILLTHGHCDHIAGIRGILRAFPHAPIVIGRNDAAMLTDPWLNLSAILDCPVTAPEADRLLAEGDRIEYAGLAFEVRELPGHSPGSVIYRLLDHEPVWVISGDTLFAGSVGRTDFPGGSAAQLFAGIRNILYTLPDDTRVFPGHGLETRVGVEKRTNPYCPAES